MQILRTSAKKHHSLQSHRAACTHVRASRIFDDGLLCSHCGQPGNMGWVYRCTQDSDGRVPINKSGLDDSEKHEIRDQARRNGWSLPGEDPSSHERMFRTESNVADINRLKPWMIKAAAAGEYTSSQIERLIDQRMHVRQQILKVEGEANTPVERGRTTFRSNKRRRQDSREVVKSTTNPARLDGQEADATKDHADPVSDKKKDRPSIEVTRRKTFQCDYTCCAACRPILRDRAWIAIDSIVHPEDPTLFPDNIDFRPVASASIILGIGQDKKHPQSIASTTTSHDSSDEFYATELREQINRRRSASFLNNVRQIFQNFVVHPKRRSKSAGSKRSCKTQSTASEEMDIADVTEDERTAALSVARPESRIGESWIMDAITNGDFSSLPHGVLQHMRQDSIDSILGTAASHSHGSPSSSASQLTTTGELHVAEGVAVTEEAVDLGMADVITQS